MNIKSKEPMVQIRTEIPKSLLDQIDREGREIVQAMPWLPRATRADVIRILLYRAVGKTSEVIPKKKG